MGSLSTNLFFLSRVWREGFSLACHGKLVEICKIGWGSRAMRRKLAVVLYRASFCMGVRIWSSKQAIYGEDGASLWVAKNEEVQVTCKRSAISRMGVLHGHRQEVLCEATSLEHIFYLRWFTRYVNEFDKFQLIKVVYASFRAE